MNTFKDALYEVVHRSGLPAKTQAEFIGQSYQMLMNSANPNMPKANLRGDKIVPLTNATGNFALLDFMERSCGRVAFRLPPPGASLKHLHNHLTRTVAEFGELLKKFDEILEDDRIKPYEKLEFEEEGHAAIREILAFIEAIKSTNMEKK